MVMKRKRAFFRNRHRGPPAQAFKRRRTPQQLAWLHIMAAAIGKNRRDSI